MHEPFSFHVMKLQELPLNLIFGWMVSGQCHISRDEVKGHRTRFKPMRTPKEGWRQTKPCNFLLLDELSDRYVLQNGTNAFANSSCVQITCGQPQGSGLTGKYMNEQIMPRVIAQLVFQLQKDVNKTACKQNVT